MKTRLKVRTTFKVNVSRHRYQQNIRNILEPRHGDKAACEEEDKTNGYKGGAVRVYRWCRGTGRRGGGGWAEGVRGCSMFVNNK